MASDTWHSMLRLKRRPEAIVFGLGDLFTVRNSCFDVAPLEAGGAEPSDSFHSLLPKLARQVCNLVTYRFEKKENRQYQKSDQPR
jgi:hypothetical protein